MHEVKRLRRRNSKTFAHGRKRRVVVRKSPFHYHDAGWHDIDTTLVNGRADQLPYRFALHEAGIGFDYESRSGGRVRVNFALSPDAPPVVERNRATYSLGDLDIVFVVQPTGVKTLRVLKGPHAPREFVWNIEADELGEAKLGTELFGQDAKRRKLELTRSIEGTRLVERWTGRVRHRDPVTRVPFWSEETEYPVVIDPTINEEIAASSDDGTERATVGWYASELKVGEYSYVYHAGMRFTGVDVPQGATIDSATLTVNVTGAGNSGYGAGVVWGYDTDDANVWEYGGSPYLYPSTINSGSFGDGKTTANAAFTRPGATGAKAVTVTSIVQEIVNRPGWASGNDMSLIILDNDAYGFVSVMEDFSAAGTDEPVLTIEYTGAVTESFPPIHRPLRVWRT